MVHVHLDFRPSRPLYVIEQPRGIAILSLPAFGETDRTTAVDLVSMASIADGYVIRQPRDRYDKTGSRWDDVRESAFRAVVEEVRQELMATYGVELVAHYS